MTRLNKADIDPVALHLHEYDACLKRKTGLSLGQIACYGSGVDGALIFDVLRRVRIAAVPITSGLGVIGGFSEAVAAIVAHIGFETFVTENSDVAGMAEAVEKGADVLMLSDDERFVAIAPGRRFVVDNSKATAQGFVAALELMNGGVAGESVLVLGCGPVGVAGAEALMDRGADVSLCDIHQETALAAFRDLDPKSSTRIRMETDFRESLGRYDLIFEATDMGNFIEVAHLTPHTIVAAPGMPLALTPEALREHGDRVLHDVLELGTATMAVQAAAELARRTEAGEGNEG